VNGEAVTARPQPSAEADAASSGRLVAWLILIAVLIAVSYDARATSGKPSPETLYHWSTAVGALIQDGIILAVVLAIARGRRDLLALRRPASIRGAFGVLAAALAAIYAWELIWSAVAHPGNEQGLTPSHWEPHHAAAYVVNGIVICTWIPFVEETTYRGLGYSLLARFGRWPAILLVGLLFGLSHGLIVSLPVIVVFGCVLAWIRSRTDSAVPGMFLHGTFNLIALVASVAVH
jgi:membrane protease YdiL (CAAX protease family)